MSARNFLRLLEANQTLSDKLDALTPAMVQKAQEVYDSWDEEDIDTYAGGGICHLIAEEIASLLEEHGILSWTHSLDYKQHVVTIAADKSTQEIYMVDVPEYAYEDGGGFTWTKIPDVKFEADDIVFHGLDWDDWVASDPEINLDDW